MRAFTPSFLFIAAVLRCGGESFTAGETDAGVDATTSDSPVAPPDANAIDASASDGSGPLDAAKPAPFSCNSPPAGTVLCDTFDNVKTVSDGFEGPALTIGGSASLDSNHFLSAPRSFLATTTKSGFFGVSSLTVQDLATTHSVSARVSIRVHAVDPLQRIPVLRLTYFPSNGKNQNLAGEIVVSDGKLYLDVLIPDDDGGLTTTTFFASSFALDAWTDIRLDVTHPPATSDMSVYVNGIKVTSSSVVLPSQLNGMGSHDASIGIIDTDGTAADEINFDNFLYVAQ